jgi:hypothetical protein
MMKTILAVAVIMVFLVSGAGLVLAQSVPDPSNKEPAEAVKEPDQERGAKPEVKLGEPKTAGKGGSIIKAYATGKKVRAANKSGGVAQSANLGTPNFSVSPGVKRDRRLRIDAAHLKYYAQTGQPVGEPFWVTERDGALMLVDPHISQNLR